MKSLLRVGILVLLATVFAFADWTGGTTQPGTMTYNGATYYKISSANELAWFANKVNGGSKTINAKLTANITLSSTQKWTPISGFNGIFDGGGFTVTKIYVPFSSGESMNAQAGFFASINSSGVVKNLFLTAVNINARADVTYAGGLVAYNSGKVLNCSVAGAVAAKNTNYDVARIFSYAGGIAGYNNGTISAVFSTASANAQTTMTTYGSATPAAYAGGIAGYNNGTILDAKGGSTKLYSTSLMGNPYAGGITAYNAGSVKNSFAYSSDYTGSVNGGVVGQNAKAVTNCFTDQSKKNINGIGAGTTSGASKRTTANMQTTDFTRILNTTNGAETDRGVWKFVSGNYPSLTGMVSGYVAYKITLNVNGNISYAYTKSNGTIDFPANPTSAEGEFIGWYDSNNKKVDGTTVWTNDATVTAKFEAVKNWNVVFVDYDGRNISTQVVKNGVMPVVPEVPSRASTAQYDYAFAGWDAEVVAAVADAEYKAVYDSSLVKIHLVFDVGKTHVDTIVEYGVEFELPAADDSTGYTFDGWYVVNAEGDTIKLGNAGDKIVITGELVVIGQYTVNSYEIVFVDYDGVELSKKSYDYGSEVETPAAPSRESTVQYDYAFTGWDAEVVAAVADAEYKAVYDSSLVKIHLVFDIGETHVDTIVEYGVEFELPAADDSTGYIFDGWYVVNAEGDTIKLGDAGDKTVITGELVVIGQYSINSYQIVFLDYDGTKLSEAKVNYNVMPAEPAAPSRVSTAQYDYAFAGWDAEVVAVAADAEYKAVYDSSLVKYHLVFDIGEIHVDTIVEYGVEFELPAADDSTGYTFDGWYVVNAEGDTIKLGDAGDKIVITGAINVVGKYEKTEAVRLARTAPQFNVSVAGRTLQIAGAQANFKVAVFDLRGNVMYAGFAYATNFSIEMPRSGSYLVRIGNQAQRVNVK